ncbi:timeless protein-domain-containing protein [Tricharina praecox]|uniref:timeless protein-domain-containing protein n=1 Tax=Tricharina praecox TaxID=43433 RepID=UPI0022209453|nr:timeless protein-domain-containing protein [Tricharina praecox]KAI5840596.1 timeless protein-domain-containing protein [Tricharina praecox]
MSRNEPVSIPDPEEAAVQAQNRDVVDPLIRAHIYSICTALGGASVEEDGRYTLGDDALACLKDLRRWLKLYDEKLNRYDVARCLSEMNLVGGDLLPIIAMWKEEDTMVKPIHRLTVACIELLTPLTWPFEKQNEQMTVNHHRHIPVLQHAQARYKTAILQHSSKKILKDIIRAALPAMAMPSYDRGARDEGIIKLVLYTLRNIAIIEHPEPGENEAGEEINRSATITAYAEQNVLDLLLTIASGIADDFRAHDTVVMEVLYHLIKGLDVEAIFRSDGEESEKRGNDLAQLLKREDDLKRAASRSSTRHNRFGSTIWMERTDGTRSFVSGQDALLTKDTGLEKLDKAKKWKKARGADKAGVSLKTEFDMTVSLTTGAKKHFRRFVEDFIDSGFNPLFESIRRAIDRDVERLLDSHTTDRCEGPEKKGLPAEEDSWAVVSAVLNQQFLITLNRKMIEWFEMKQWTALQAGMRCFTQILYTVQEMALSPIEDDQEIAENIQNRLFYEETTMDLIYNICRSYTKQPFKWLDDCTEMAYVHLKLLEKYSQQHEHMFVRSRRRQSKKAKEKAAALGEAAEHEEDDSELVAASKSAAAERAFDFTKFEAKYLNQNCINTFIAFLTYYQELNATQIMRAIKMFHRISEKRKMEVLLYRLDLVNLLHRMMQGSAALDRKHPAYKEVDQFTKHFLRKLFKKLEAEPAMYVELLFTKLSSTTHYLQHGYTKELHVAKPRAAAELMIKPGSGVQSHSDQVGVGVAALLDDNKSSDVEWLKDVIRKAVTERKSFEDESAARLTLEAHGPSSEAAPSPTTAGTPPDILIDPRTDERARALFKDAVLRFLLKLVGCEPVEPNETPETKWLIPARHTSQTLAENLTLLQKFANDPPTFDNTAAADLLKRKLPSTTARTRRPVLSSDSSGSSADEEDEATGLFEPGGPTSVHAPQRSKGAKRKRRLVVEAEAANEELSALALEKRRKREEAERLKLSKIKSDKFVHDSDDNSDVEGDEMFYAREREIRSLGPQPVVRPEKLPLVRGGGSDGEEGDGDGEREAPTKRRKKVDKPEKEKKSIFNDDDSDDEGGRERERERESTIEPITRKTGAVIIYSSSDSEKEDVVMRDVSVVDEAEDADSESEEDKPVAARRRRAVVVDSDDE